MPIKKKKRFKRPFNLELPNVPKTATPGYDINVKLTL